MTHDFIGALLPEDTKRPPCGEFYCAGHPDEGGAHVHSTPWEYFGRFGVAVTRIDGQPPKVSLIEMPTPQADFTIAEASEFAYQFIQAIAVAQRAAVTVPADLLAERVRELFLNANP